MAIVSRTSAKAYFETGDKPTQAQFGDFIDSALFYEDTSDFGRSLVSASSATSARSLLGSGAVGNNLFTAITTASGQTQLGGGLIGRQVFEAITTASGRSALDAQPLNTNLTAFAALSGSADKIPYFTGAGAMALGELIATTTSRGSAFLSNPIILSNNTTTPNTKIDFAAGSQTFTNGTNQAIISATTAILQSSGSWAAGNDQNKLDTGARANSTWYHSYIIQNNTSGVYDVLFSTSATSPTIPSGWTNVAKIKNGQVMTDGSGNLRTFLKFANGFTKYTASGNGYAVDYSVSSPAAGNNTLISIMVPNQANIGALVKAQGETGTTGSDAISFSFDGSVISTTNITLNIYEADVYAIGDSGRYIVREKLCITNSAQIKLSVFTTAGARALSIMTLGYFDLNQ